MEIDRIERDIVIDAPPVRVWELVTAPEFWVGDGDPTGLELREGVRVVAEHGDDVRYPMVVERVCPPHYIAYRWASAFPGAEPTQGRGTLVELFVTAEAGQARLRVVESGFAALAADAEARRHAAADNAGGWAQELDGFKARAEKYDG